MVSHKFRGFMCYQCKHKMSVHKQFCTNMRCGCMLSWEEIANNLMRARNDAQYKDYLKARFPMGGI